MNEESNVLIWRPHNATERIKSHTELGEVYLYNGNDGHEHRRRTESALMEVPSAVRLAWQNLIGHVAHEALVHAQPHLIQ